MNGDRSTCVSADELLKFLRGELAERRAEQVAMHVEECEACQQKMAELDEDDLPAGDSGEEGLPFADESQCGRLLDRIGGGAGPVAATRSASVASDPQRRGEPQRLGDYVLEQRLGEGGMGTVYRGRHVTLGTPAAIKILHPHRQADRVTIGRFEREMVALGRLDHPHIVRALDAGEDSGQHYLAMEYVDGIDLGRLVKHRGSLPIAEAAEAARQAALGLAYVHQHGRVHRDVKPSNLMLASDGTVKLLDLGLARVEEYPLEEKAGPADDILGGSTVDLTRTHQVMGTLEYMAPEQATDSHSADDRADLYSLGCTLYKLITGHSPFASSRSISGLSQLLAHVERPAAPVTTVRPEVPAGLSDLIDRMLQKEPDRRPQSAQEVAEALRPFTSGAELASLAATADELNSDSGADGLAPTMIDSAAGTTAVSGRVDERPTAAGSLIRIAAAVALMALLAAGLLAMFALPRLIKPKGTLIVQTDSEEAASLLSKTNAARLVGEQGEFPLRSGRLDLPVGEYVVVNGGSTLLSFSANKFSIEHGQQAVLSVGHSAIGITEDQISLNESENRQVDKNREVAERAIESTALQTIQLIPLIDPQRDIRADDWTLADAALVSELSRPSMMMIPYDPPDRYRLEFTATRLISPESLHLGLVAGDEPFVLTIDSHPHEGSLSGLYQLDGMGILQRADRVHRGQVLPKGRPVSVSVTVDASGTRVAVEAIVEGKRITSWRGSKSQLSGTGVFTPTERGVLFLANWTSTIRIDDLRITPLEGEGRGRIVEFADPGEQPFVAAAQWVTWKGGTATILSDQPRDEAGRTPQAIGGFELLGSFEGHTGPVKTVAWSPDDKFVASGSGWPGGDKSVRIWDLESGDVRHVVETGWNVMDVAFSPDSQSLLVGGMAGEMMRLDVESGEVVQTYPLSEFTKLEQVGWTPDATRVIAGAGREDTLLVFDSTTGELIHRLEFSADCLAFDVTPDSRRLAVGLGDSSVHVVDLESGETIRRLSGPESLTRPVVFCLDISPAGDRVMAGYKEHTVRVWNLESGGPLIDLRTNMYGHEAVLFSNDGERAVVTGPNGAVGLFDLNTGTVLGTTPMLEGDGWGAALSPDGQRVLTAGGVHYRDGGWRRTGDYALRVWKIGVAEQLSRDQPSEDRYLVDIEQHAAVPENPRLVGIDLHSSLWFADADAAILTSLPELESLNLAGTRISQAGLRRLSQLPRLESLSLSGTAVTEWPPELATVFPKLQVLDLSNTRIAGESLAAMAAIETLEELSLTATRIDDEHLDSLDRFASLRRLDLSRTAVTDAGLESLPALPKLERLDLAGTSISSLSVLSEEKFPRLRSINVMDTTVEQSAIAAYRTMREDVEIISGFDTFDLIAELDPELDAVHNRVAKSNGKLSIDAPTRFMLPVYLPQEFEISMSVRQTSDGRNSPELELPLPDGTRVMVGFDHWPGDGGFAIIHGIDGKMEKDSDVKREGQVVRPGAMIESKLGVRVEGRDQTIRISLYVDGEEWLAWEGERDRLSPEFYGSPADALRPTMSVPGTRSSMVVSELTITPLSGSVRLVDRGPSHADPDRGVAEWVLRNNGMVGIPLDTSNRWSLATHRSVDQLPEQPFRVGKIAELGNSSLPSSWWEQVGQLQSLYELNLIGTEFDNRDLAAIADVTSIDMVYAQRSSLDDTGLSYLARLPRLKRLGIGDSPVTAEGLMVLENHPAIERLTIILPDASTAALRVAASLPRLTELVFGKMKLHTDWSATLAELPQLERLALIECRGVGTQDLARFASANRLKFLSLRDVNLYPASMASIGQMSALRSLDLHKNPIGDEEIAQLGNLRNLETLDLAETRITDAGLQAIANLRQLKSLSLSGAEGVTDASLETLQGFRNLTSLDLVGSQISSQGAEALRQSLPKCRVEHGIHVASGGWLDLRGQRVDDAALDEILRSTWPGTLMLEGHAITDTSIDSISEIQGLHTLALHRTRISESGISQLRNHPTLRRIEFWNMPQITDDVTEHLITMPRLDHLIFKSTGAYGLGLERFHERGLVGINLGHEALNGDILRRYLLPLQNLAVLDLAGSKIRDDDVELITQFSRVGQLHLGYNENIRGPGLVHIKDIADLHYLLLDHSGVNDEGLKFLAGAQQLKRLNLKGLAISDESIELLASLKGLKSLALEETELSDEGIERLRALMPETEITPPRPAR